VRQFLIETASHWVFAYKLPLIVITGRHVICMVNGQPGIRDSQCVLPNSQLSQLITSRDMEQTVARFLPLTLGRTLLWWNLHHSLVQVIKKIRSVIFKMWAMLTPYKFSSKFIMNCDHRSDDRQTQVIYNLSHANLWQQDR